eukprot:1137947-Pelagomonas_calceolata.AAC.4
MRQSKILEWTLLLGGMSAHAGVQHGWGHFPLEALMRRWEHAPAAPAHQHLHLKKKAAAPSDSLHFFHWQHAAAALVYTGCRRKPLASSTPPA